MSAVTPNPPVSTGSAPQLAFAVTGAESVRYAAVPTLSFRVGIESLGGESIRSIVLDAQLQIAARRRSYGAENHDRLFELFGPAASWGTSLRTLLWTRATLIVPPFDRRTEVELPVTCTYDLEVAASRYLQALQDGEVPLEFLFSGMVFYTGPSGQLQTTRISWEHEAEYRLPVGVWRETMDRHFPNSAWLRLSRASFDRLCTYKSRHALATWEDTLDSLLRGREEG